MSIRSAVLMNTPGERIVNEVTAPVYPSINGRWTPSVYGYTYLLSPAQTWTQFGTLDIIINTPFCLIKSSISDFKKTENGYRLSYNGLPSQELEFSLCRTENPEERWHGIQGHTPVLSIFIGMAVVVGVVVFGVIQLRKKQKREVQG